MTIKIEQEAIIRVVDTENYSLPCHRDPPLKPPSIGGFRASAAEPPSTSPKLSVVQKPADDDFCPELLSLDADEDCISLSSFGSASSFGGRSTERCRVSFAAPLVTEVQTRPRTKDCEKRLLFYTQSETDRFRQVYREERQSVSPGNMMPESSDKEPPTSECSSRRRISRVVVEHNDGLETLYDLHDFSSYSLQKGGASIDDVFFDNDSFWSGSITWY